MASTARRIGLSTRSGRKTSREEDGIISRSRKISSGTKLSREENTSSIHYTRQPFGAIQDGELYCTPDRLQKNDLSRSTENISSDKFAVIRENADQPKRKISVYARPEPLERKLNQQGSQTRWQKFLIQYEPFILSSIALLILSVSFYIFFVERQSLFSKQGV